MPEKMFARALSRSSTLAKPLLPESCSNAARGRPERCRAFGLPAPQLAPLLLAEGGAPAGGDGLGCGARRSSVAGLCRRKPGCGGSGAERTGPGAERLPGGRGPGRSGRGRARRGRAAFCGRRGKTSGAVHQTPDRVRRAVNGVRGRCSPGLGPEVRQLRRSRLFADASDMPE